MGKTNTRYFEYRQGSSNKFWEITLNGSEYSVRYGRIGSKGSTKTKTFASEQKAKEAANRLMLQKHAKGYAYIADGGGKPAAASKPPATAAAAAKEMTYEAFMAMEGPWPSGKASSEWSSFPLSFADHERVIAEAADFSVIDDFMSDLDMDDFEEEFEEHFPNYRGLATICARTARESDPDYIFDSYSEFFLCVDVSKPKKPVLLWTGECQFEQLFPSFAKFHASLADWNPSNG